jgi:hypothetical protein
VGCYESCRARRVSRRWACRHAERGRWAGRWACRSGIATSTGGLLAVLTARRSRKAGAIRAVGRFGLCVQDDSPPYRYVSAEGPVVSEEEADVAERLAMARRYLGGTGATVTSPTIRILGGRTWRSGCDQSTGSARIRPRAKPRGSACPASSDVIRLDAATAAGK